METSNYQHKDLLGKDKADLEKIKLALEIDAIQNTLNKKTDESKKWWNKENAKLSVVIILTGLVTIGSNLIVNEIKSKTDTGFKFKEANANHFFSLTDQFAETTDTIILTNLSHKISTFTVYNQDNLESIIESEKKKYGRIYVQLINIKSSNESIDSEKNQESVDFLEKFENAEKANKFIEEDDSKKEATEIRLQLKLDSAVEVDPKLNSIVTSTELIQESIINIIELEDEFKPKNPTITTSEVRWFKEGYFLLFDNENIKIYLDDGKLNKKDGYIDARICSGSDKECFQKGKYLRIYQKIQAEAFEFKGKNYRINLRAIDRAGKNPFNWAAYITLDQWDN